MSPALAIGTGTWLGQRGALRQPQLLLPLGLAVVAFIVDLVTPHGMLDGFLYVLAVLACIWVPSANAAFYTALGLTPLLAIGLIASPAGAPMSVALANLGVGTATVWIAAAAVWHNARASREKEALLTQIRNLQRMTVSAAEEQRTELSRWLHEGIAQELATIGWGLDHIARRAGSAVVQTKARELRAVIDHAQRAIRSKAMDLRHSDDDKTELRARIEAHVDAFSVRTETPIAMSGVEHLRSLPASQSKLCLGIVQEALTNVAKHARASRVVIEFQLEQNGFYTIITDDGRGLSAADLTKPDSLGLLGIRERLLAIGGRLTVSGAAPRGVRLEAQFPLAQNSNKSTPGGAPK